MPNHAPPQATRGSERGCDTSVCETPPSHELGALEAVPAAPHRRQRPELNLARVETDEEQTLGTDDVEAAHAWSRNGAHTPPRPRAPHLDR